MSQALRPDSPVQAGDFPSIARSLRPIIEEEAVPSWEASTPTPRAVAALRDAGIFTILVPKELGGPGADMATWTDTLAELSYADGGIGWAALSNTTVVAIAAGWVSDEVAAGMFGHGEISAAGQTVPKGVCTRDGSRFRVKGDFSFGSATFHADYVASGAPVLDTGGNPVLSAYGFPEMWIFIVPNDKVVFKGNWDVFGLRGNGSFDYTIPEQHVEEGCVFMWSSPAKRGKGIYLLGNNIVGQAAHAGWALGMGRRAIDEVLRNADKGPDRHSPAIGSSEAFLHDIGRYDAQLRAARLFIHDAYGNLEDIVNRGDQPTAEDFARGYAAMTNATRTSVNIVRDCFEWTGLRAIRPSVMQRLYCDMSVGALHITQSRQVFIRMGQALVASNAEPAN
jgi:alkylation response protein AidB-like acyl-CoA dehydrogenase